jgi:hypothetical protein
MKVRITIGDWSGDGHSHAEQFVYESNKSVEEIRQAYKDSCRLTGLSFNHNEDYTGLLKPGDYGTDRQICTEYQESSISKFAKEILKTFNINIEKYVESDSDDYIDCENFIILLIDFIKLSLPDLKLEEASFKKSELKDMPPVNGWWNEQLNCQFGYGVMGE